MGGVNAIAAGASTECNFRYFLQLNFFLNFLTIRLWRFSSLQKCMTKEIIKGHSVFRIPS